MPPPRGAHARAQPAGAVERAFPESVAHDLAFTRDHDGRRWLRQRRAVSA